MVAPLLFVCTWRLFREVVRNSVESLATLENIDYAIAAFLATGFCETALAMEDSNEGI